MRNLPFFQAKRVSQYIGRFLPVLLFSFFSIYVAVALDLLNFDIRQLASEKVVFREDFENVQSTKVVVKRSVADCPSHKVVLNKSTSKDSEDVLGENISRITDSKDALPVSAFNGSDPFSNTFVKEEKNRIVDDENVVLEVTPAERKKGLETNNSRGVKDSVNSKQPIKDLPDKKVKKMDKDDVNAGCDVGSIAKGWNRYGAENVYQVFSLGKERNHTKDGHFSQRVETESEGVGVSKEFTGLEKDKSYLLKMYIYVENGSVKVYGVKELIEVTNVGKWNEVILAVSNEDLINLKILASKKSTLFFIDDVEIKDITSNKVNEGEAGLESSGFALEKKEQQNPFSNKFSCGYEGDYDDFINIAQKYYCDLNPSDASCVGLQYDQNPTNDYFAIRPILYLSRNESSGKYERKMPDAWNSVENWYADKISGFEFLQIYPTEIVRDDMDFDDCVSQNSRKECRTMIFNSAKQWASDNNPEGVLLVVFVPEGDSDTYTGVYRHSGHIIILNNGVPGVGMGNVKYKFVIAHELGHSMGLTHSYFDSVMGFSSEILPLSTYTLFDTPEYPERFVACMSGLNDGVSDCSLYESFLGESWVNWTLNIKHKCRNRRTPNFQYPLRFVINSWRSGDAFIVNSNPSDVTGRFRVDGLTYQFAYPLTGTVYDDNYSSADDYIFVLERHEMCREYGYDCMPIDDIEINEVPDIYCETDNVPIMIYMKPSIQCLNGERINSMSFPFDLTLVPDENDYVEAYSDTYYSSSSIFNYGDGFYVLRAPVEYTFLLNGAESPSGKYVFRGGYDDIEICRNDGTRCEDIYDSEGSVRDFPLNIAPNNMCVRPVTLNVSETHVGYDGSVDLSWHWDDTSIETCQAGSTRYVWTGEKENNGSETITGLRGSTEFILGCDKDGDVYIDTRFVEVDPPESIELSGNITACGGTGLSSFDGTDSLLKGVLVEKVTGGEPEVYDIHSGVRDPFSGVINYDKLSAYYLQFYLWDDGTGFRTESNKMPVTIDTISRMFFHEDWGIPFDNMQWDFPICDFSVSCEDPTSSGSFLSSKLNMLFSSSTGGADSAVQIIGFTANPSEVEEGGSVTLSWYASNAEECMLTGGGVNETFSGSETSMCGASFVTPELFSDSTFQLECVDSDNNHAAASASVSVVPSSSTGSAEISVEISADPINVPFNGTTTLNWSSVNAVSCIASGNWHGVKALSGTRVFRNLDSDQNYVITCDDDMGNSVSDSVLVLVDPPPAVQTVSGRVECQFDDHIPKTVEIFDDTGGVVASTTSVVDPANAKVGSWQVNYNFDSSRTYAIRPISSPPECIAYDTVENAHIEDGRVCSSYRGDGCPDDVKAAGQCCEQGYTEDLNGIVFGYLNCQSSCDGGSGGGGTGGYGGIDNGECYEGGVYNYFTKGEYAYGFVNGPNVKLEIPGRAEFEDGFGVYINRDIEFVDGRAVNPDVTTGPNSTNWWHAAYIPLGNSELVIPGENNFNIFPLVDSRADPQKDTCVRSVTLNIDHRCSMGEVSSVRATWLRQGIGPVPSSYIDLTWEYVLEQGMSPEFDVYRVVNPYGSSNPNFTVDRKVAVVPYSGNGDYSYRDENMMIDDTSAELGKIVDYMVFARVPENVEVCEGETMGQGTISMSTGVELNVPLYSPQGNVVIDNDNCRVIGWARDQDADVILEMADPINVTLWLDGNWTNGGIGISTAADIDRSDLVSLWGDGYGRHGYAFDLKDDGRVNDGNAHTVEIWAINKPSTPGGNVKIGEGNISCNRAQHAGLGHIIENTQNLLGEVVHSVKGIFGL